MVFLSIEGIVNIAKKQRLAKEVRLYIILGGKHYFLNDGKIKEGFGPVLDISNDRDSVLSAFSKMSFLFDEIIRLRIIDHRHDQKSVELLYLLHLIPVNRKIRTFLDWKVFSAEFTQQMSRLFQVRNDTVHCISLDEVRYNPKKSHSLSKTRNFQLFRKDMTDAWKKLLQIYLLEQDKVQWDNLKKEIVRN